MAVFYYKAKNKNAETIVGEIEARTKDEAVDKIDRFGLVPVLVEPASSDKVRSLKTGVHEGRQPKPDSVPAAGRAVTAGRSRRSVGIKDLYLFSRQFASLMKSGISILHALQVMTRQTKNSRLKRAVAVIRAEIQGGKSLSDSLQMYPDVFPPIYVSMSRAGEESGKLQGVIAGLADYLKSQMEIRNKIMMALVYPLMMLLFGMAAVAFILTSVMPKITRVFLDTQQILPLPTRIVMRISDILVHGWGWIFAGALIIGVLFRQWKATDHGRRMLCRVQLRIPFLSELWKKEDLSRFARTMALLIESGVPIITAMKLSIPIVSNVLIREELTACQEELVAGRSFAEQIKQMTLIPDIMGDMLAVGEEAGSLGLSLNDIADHYEQEIGDAVKVMTTLFEPVMIVLIGALIGFVVIAMLMPIFQMDMFAS